MYIMIGSIIFILLLVIILYISMWPWVVLLVEGFSKNTMIVNNVQDKPNYTKQGKRKEWKK